MTILNSWYNRETEYITHISDLVKAQLYHSTGKNEYENVMGPQLGSWKYTPKASSYVGTVHNTSNLTTNPAALDMTQIDAANNGGVALDCRKPYEGNVWRIDSFPIADDEDGLYTGREFSIPLSILLGFFRIKTMIPTFALGSIDIKVKSA